MSQTQALPVGEGDSIDYTPGSAVTGGNVIVIGTVICVAPVDIAAGALGSVATSGNWKLPKTSDSFTAGDAVYWDVDGTPVTGTALSGAADSSAATGNLAGWATKDAASGDDYVETFLSAAKRTATIAGSVTADDITGSDSSLGIVGAAPATTSSAGGAVALAGGIGGSVSGAGGAVTLTGGAGTLNANGGAVTIAGGAKNGSGADGVVTIGATNTSAINIGAAGIVERHAGYVQVNGNAAVTATTGGATTGLIPAGASLVTVTSDSVNKQISLPAATVGDEIEILVGTTGCELISAVAAHKANEVTIGATNELALTAESLYRCKYTKTNYWIVTGLTKLGAVESALVPDSL